MVLASLTVLHFLVHFAKFYSAKCLLLGICCITKAKNIGSFSTLHLKKGAKKDPYPLMTFLAVLGIGCKNTKFDTLWNCRIKMLQQKCFHTYNRIFHLHISHTSCLPPPPKKFASSLCFHFSRVLQWSQEKLKTMLKCKILGGNRGVLWEMCK